MACDNAAGTSPSLATSSVIIVCDNFEYLGNTKKMTDDPQVLPLVRHEVRSILTRSPAFNQLRPGQQEQIAHDAVKIAAYLVAPEGIPANALEGAVTLVAGEVDFPGFVAGLIRGTFNAIVASSIEQMKAYGELLQNVARSVDKFGQVAHPDKRRHLAVTRQQMLASMVLMGMNWPVITGEPLPPGIIFDAVNRPY